MKPMLIMMCLLASLSLNAHEPAHSEKDQVNVIIDNHEMIVTEYVSTSGKDVCGPGMHSHNPHLTVLVTDAVVRLTTEDGNTQIFELKAGQVLWSEAETHMAINNGDQPAIVYLIERKK